MSVAGPLTAAAGDLEIRCRDSAAVDVLWRLLRSNGAVFQCGAEEVERIVVTEESSGRRFAFQREAAVDSWSCRFL
jgi:hypothetical protein